MSTRRDVLFGLGVGAVSVAGGGLALVTRMDRYPGLEFPVGETGAPRGDSAVAMACTGGEVTPGAVEGPFYTPASPRRFDIRNSAPKMAAFILTGRVLDPQCRPIAGAVLDFWQTGDEGGYDVQGYGYRGHQYTDAQGRFQLVTVRPTEYTAMSIHRTPHIHAKVQGRGTGLLTTQLYMPDFREMNATDGFYGPGLEVAFTGKDGDAQLAAFDFVLGAA